MRNLIVILAAFLIGLSTAARADLTPDEARRAEALIAKFSAREFAVRQQAVDALVAMGPDVLPLVRKTLAETADGEVRLRCEMVVKALVPAPTPHPDPLEGLEETTREEIAALVGKFDADDGATRNEAVARVVAIGPIALPSVRNAAEGPKRAELKRCCLEAERGIKYAKTPAGSFLTIREVPDANDPREQMIGDFEDGTRQGWFAWYGSPLNVVADPRARGKHWLRMDLTADPWPGLGLHYRGAQDWSHYRAVRFRVFNPYDEVINLAVRADDTRGGEYNERYNRDQGMTLKPGANDVEVSLASFRAGTIGSRGLDLRKIRLFRFFLGQPKKRYTFYLDDVRLVPYRPLPGGVRMLSDFDDATAMQWRPEKGAGLRVVGRDDAADGRALEVRFARNMWYSGVVFDEFDGDWLAGDLLSMDVVCPRGRATPPLIYLALRDTGEAPQEFVVALDKGVNRISVPLSLAGFAALGHVRTLTICTDSADADAVAFIDNVRIESVKGFLHGEPEHRPDHFQARLKLDFATLPLEEFARVGAVLWVPLASGETRSIHCTTATNGPGAFALGPTSFEDIDPKRPVTVWGYSRYKARWRLVRRDVRLDGEGAVTLDFNDAARFGY